MSPETIFNVHLALGYIPWFLFCGAYVWPKLGVIDRFAAHRAIAVLHSFRFFGLIFIVPGLVGPSLPAAFAIYAAYGDLATGLLAMLALVTARVRPLFWTFVVAFNVVGTCDIVLDYAHGVQLGLPALAGDLGAGYAIIILFVPLLMITHATAFALLFRPRRSSSLSSIKVPGLRP